MAQYSGRKCVLSHENMIVSESIYILKEALVWLSRIGRCRGFGVQSPTDYSFIRYVVNEHYPYYAYADLAARHPADGRLQRKLGRLCMRIANFLQPSVIVNGCVSDSLPDYLRAGCRRAAVRSDAADADTADLIVVPATAGGERLFADAVGKTTGRSVLVVTGIKDNRAARRFWRAVVADRRVGVTFDLYYAGVAFFDTKRYKHNYIVNF